MYRHRTDSDLTRSPAEARTYIVIAVSPNPAQLPCEALNVGRQLADERSRYTVYSCASGGRVVQQVGTSTWVIVEENLGYEGLITKAR